MEKRVHADLHGLLSMMPQENFSKEALSEIRKASSVSFGRVVPQDASVMVRDEWIPGPEGAPKVRVRLYAPGGSAEDRPGILYLHGGGYILGSPEMCDGVCCKLAGEIGSIVVSVDYRLAPDHPYPAPLEDCYAALKWFTSSAPKLGVDAGRIAVTGASAGGGLTAALALLARDRGGPDIVFQAPLCPMLDDRNITPSSHEFTDKRLWNRSKNLFGWEMYLGELYGGDIPPYAAAARAADLSGLPPTYTYVGELDLFRDETTEYVTRLLQVGVPTEFHIYPGCFHAFDLFTEVAAISRRAEEEYLLVMKNALMKK